MGSISNTFAEEEEGTLRMEDLVKEILQPNLNEESLVKQTWPQCSRKQACRIEGAETKTKCREKPLTGITVENPPILKEEMAIQALKRHWET